MRQALPIADAPALARATRRTRLARGVLALALAGLVAAAALAAGRTGDAAAVAAPSHQNLEIVLDLSGSVTSDADGAFARALRVVKGEARHGTVGLVLFSDVAEETLPPGSRPSQLDPFIEYFADPVRPRRNPWSNGFSAGTAISQGVAAARRALERDRAAGRVVIISDLGEAIDDRTKLGRELRALVRLPGVRVQVYPLPITDYGGLRFVQSLLGPRSISNALEKAPPAEGNGNEGFPFALVTLAVLTAVALAANELVSVSLRWRTA